MCAQWFSLGPRLVVYKFSNMLEQGKLFKTLKNWWNSNWYLLMRSPDLRQVNMIIQSLYMMKNGTMNISRTVQNQTAKYIFSLMTFCDKTHKPLWFWGPPAAPTFGTVQLTLKISREGGLKIQISLFVFSPGKNQWCLNTFAILEPNWVTFFPMHFSHNHA